MKLVELIANPAVNLVFVSLITFLILSIEIYKNRKPSYWMLAAPIGLIIINLISGIGEVKLPGLTSSSQELFLLSLFGSPFVFLIMIYISIWIDTLPDKKLRWSIIGTVLVYILFYMLLINDG